MLFGHREMCVAADANLGKMNDGYVASMTINCIPPLSGHLQPHSPSILAGIFAGLLGDKITVKDDDGNLGKFHELGHGDADRRERPTGTWERLRDFSLWE
jgi:hypothetical protein